MVTAGLAIPSRFFLGMLAGADWTNLLRETLSEEITGHSPTAAMLVAASPTALLLGLEACFSAKVIFRSSAVK
jgi:hypothetical protein